MTCKLAECAFHSIIQVFNKDVEYYWPRYRAFAYTTSDLPPSELCDTDNKTPVATHSVIFNSSHCLLIYLYFVNLPTKVKVKNTDCFSIIHQANHHTVEWNQVGQLWFPLCKSMLTFNCITVFHMFENAFWEVIPSHLPRDCIKGDLLVIPHFFSLTFLEDRSDICFLPVYRNLSQIKR